MNTNLNQTQQRVTKVLERMIQLTQESTDDAEMFSLELEHVLTNLAGDDAFGTEMSRDPRGDGREGIWSMNRVEGIDD